MSEDRKLVQWEEVRRMLEGMGMAPPPGPGDDGADPREMEDGRPQRPEVELPRKGRTLRMVAEELGKILAKVGYYRSPDNLVVRVVDDQGKFAPVGPQGFRTDVARYVYLWMWTGKGDDRRQVEETMTVEAARGMLESECLMDELPRLERVSFVRLPVLRDSGDLELLPIGYDEEARTYTVEGIRIDETVDLEDALGRLAEMFRSFPWVEGEMLRLEDRPSYAVQITAMLSLWCRLMLPDGALRPAFIWDSNQRRTGKSLLGKIAALVSYGKMNATRFDRDEKFSDKITAMMFGGEELCFIDNLKRKLGGEAIEMLLTAPDWGDRKKGVSEFFSLPNRMWVLVSSNHADTSEDMAHRALVARLFVEEGDTRARKRVAKEALIKESQLKTAAFRGRVLSALWAIVRHWDAVGRPDAEKGWNGVAGEVLPGFEEFCDLIPPMVRAAGMVDPVRPPAEGEELSGELRDMKRLMAAIAEDMHEREATADKYEFVDVVEISRREELFLDVIGASDEEGDAIKGRASWRSAFGRKLGEKRGSGWETPHGRLLFGDRSKPWSRAYEVTLSPASASVESEAV